MRKISSRKSVEMEKVWNIVHYFVYRADYRFTYYFYKYTGVFKLYSLPFVKKRFEKANIKDPAAGLMNVWGKYDGLSSITAGILMGLLPFILFLGLHFFYFIIFYRNGLPKFEVFIYPMFVYGAISFLISHFLLFRKDKYLKYFKEFDEKPRKWKIKWAWISLGVILFPFIVLVSSFVAMS
jgi:hypothetical protein